MEAVDQVRRDEIREKGSEHKALMYKTRFIWLKNPCNLTEGQAFRLGELERLNLKTIDTDTSGTTAVPVGQPHEVVLVGNP